MNRRYSCQSSRLRPRSYTRLASTRVPSGRSQPQEEAGAIKAMLKEVEGLQTLLEETRVESPDEIKEEKEVDAETSVLPQE